MMTVKKEKCPTCKQLTQEKFRPFCSDRCKMVDLGRWFGESYAIPVSDTMDEMPDDSENKPQDHKDP